MNQNMTPQRPPQQRPQGQPQRPPQRPTQGGGQRPPQGRPPQRPQGQPPRQPQKPERSPYTLAAMIALIVTGALLVLCIIGLCVALALSGGEGNTDGDGGGGGGGFAQNDEPANDTPATVDGVKTTPSRSSYVIPNGSDYTTISGIDSQYAVLIDLDTFQAVAGLNPDTKICPASMTKVMTVLIACENMKSLSDKVKITAEDANYGLDNNVSRSHLLDAGKEYTVKDLLYLIYYESDTTACLAISRYIAGSEVSFAQMMTAKAKEMGLTQTKFTNSTGLDDNQYYTTCREMAAIMAYALENPQAKKILTSTGKYYFNSPALKASDGITPGWRTDSKRLGSVTPEGTSMTILGGKTGSETVSGSCLVTYAKNSSGKQFIQVIVGGGSNINNEACTKDVKYIYNTYAK